MPPWYNLVTPRKNERMSILSFLLYSAARTISDYECNIVTKLSALYGAVVASAIMVALFCLATITIVVKSLSWKPNIYVSNVLKSVYVRKHFIVTNILSTLKHRNKKISVKLNLPNIILTHKTNSLKCKWARGGMLIITTGSRELS